MNFEIYTVFPRGYCAGVHRAVKMLMEVVANYPAPIYVNHEIIHNKFIVKMFERKGVIFEEDISKIPEQSRVVISAHGTGPTYYKNLRERKIEWIDATCPLVEKVHREARIFIEKGYHILYIGKRGHQEANGVLDENPEKFTIIENEHDFQNFLENIYKELKLSKIALLTQTTLSVEETEGLIGIIQGTIPTVELPKSGDICYATTNRQNALKELAKIVDMVLIVGSKNSSNSSKLQRLAESLGKKSYLIDSPDEIEQDWLENTRSVGVSAGASGPEEIVENVVEKLTSLGGKFVQEIRVTEENIVFPYSLNIQS